MSLNKYALVRSMPKKKICDIIFWDTPEAEYSKMYFLCGKLQTWDDSSGSKIWGWEVSVSGHCIRSWIRPTLHPRRLRSQLGSLGHMDLLLQGEPVDQASRKSFTEVKVLTSIFPLLDIVGPRELDWQRSVFFPANCIVGSKAHSTLITICVFVRYRRGFPKKFMWCL